MISLFESGFRGLSDTLFSGVKGSVYRSVGIDHRSEPGLIKVHQKLTKDSGETIDELCKVSVNVSDGSRLWFSSESGKIWREVSGTYTLLGELSFPDFDMRTAEATTNDFDISGEISVPNSMQFKDDGTKLYVMGLDSSSTFGRIFQYDLTTAYDITTASYSGNAFSADTDSNGMFISDDGLNLFVCEDNGGTSVIKYTMSTAWDLSTASSASNTFDFSARGSRGSGVSFKSDGTKMFILLFDSDEIAEYDLSTAWDLTSASYVQSFSTTVDINIGGFYMNTSGTKMFYANGGAIIKELNLSTPWDVSTAVDTGVDYDADATLTDADFALTYAHDGSGFYLAGQSAPEKVYQFSLLEEDTNVTVLGAEEFLEKIYLATKNRLTSITVSNITNISSDLEVIGSFNYGDDTSHPMVVINNKLLVGDKHTISTVTSSEVFTAESDFNLSKTERVITLTSFDTNVLVGTKTTMNGRVLRWDTVSESWSAEDEIFIKGGVSAFLKDDNYVYVLDEEGTIWFYNGEQNEVLNRMPEIGDNKIKINPNATAYWKKTPIFGVSNGENNPILQGVYGFGKYSRNYTTSLSLDFPVPTEEFSDIEIGTISVDGKDLYVAWKDSKDVGVAKLDYESKYRNAYIETMAIADSKTRHQLKTIVDAIVPYYSLPEITGYYDINAANFNKVALDVSSVESFPTTMVFNNDGTVLFFLGAGSQRVYKMNLETAYDISTASYDSIALDVSGQETSPTTMFYNNNGTSLYVAGVATAKIYEYTLSTAYDISTATYDSEALDVSGQDTKPQKGLFNETGSILYLLGSNNDNIYKYTLSTAYDVSSATYDSVVLDVSSKETNPTDMVFNNDGTLLYLLGYDNGVSVYSLSTPYDISTASFKNIALSVFYQEESPHIMLFNNDGSRLYVAGINSVSDANINEYKISNASVVVGWKKAYETNFTDYEMIEDTERKIIKPKNPSVTKSANPQFRLDLISKKNTAPKIEDFLFDLAPIGKK